MKTLIILDWDDTLFPTSWVMGKGINISNTRTKERHIHYFKRLDELLYRLLKRFMKYGKVVVVTNAMTKWVIASSEILPNTQQVIMENIEVISARERYQKKVPHDMYKWKKWTFEKEVMEYFMGRHKVENIISVGDAEYEFRALTELYENFKKKKRILKAIRLLSSPTYESLIDQLEVLERCVEKVCEAQKHMDLKFALSTECSINIM